AEYLRRTVGLVRALLETIDSPGATSSSQPGSTVFQAAVIEGINRLLRYGELATIGALLEGVALLELGLGALSSLPENLLLELIDAMARGVRQILESRLERDPSLRRVWQVIDLTLATMRGIFRFGLLNDPRGFDAVDEYDCREWLRLNGASESSLDSGYL